jgi:hypothetical protein
MPSLPSEGSSRDSDDSARAARGPAQRTGSDRRDRRARAVKPVVKVQDLAWLEFEKPDLEAAERFAHDFGFATAHRDDAELHLRGTLPRTQCLVIREGARSRVGGPAFRAGTRTDLERLARANGADVRDRNEPGGGAVVDLHDPAGIPVRVVALVDELPELPRQQPLTLNFGTVRRRNATQRAPAGCPGSRADDACRPASATGRPDRQPARPRPDGVRSDRTASCSPSRPYTRGCTLMPT